MKFSLALLLSKVVYIVLPTTRVSSKTHYNPSNEHNSYYCIIGYFTCLHKFEISIPMLGSLKYLGVGGEGV